ncbi:MAG: FAD-dependent oxidoreductase, partial [Gammaproteobacteria bacterium]|nr:FAD-dependent oxidoreductase [Gammaproteobacteria bacterium]
MEKFQLDRRLQQMLAEGVIFQTNAHVGQNVKVDELRKNYDAILLAGGACAPRDLPIPGRELKGIYFAMDYLTLQNKRCEGDQIDDKDFISAKGKNVIIIGGGDTGADCLGTANRQGAMSVHQLEIMPRPPDIRSHDNPWPEWPQIYRVSAAHEEGVQRVYSASTKQFLADDAGNVKELELIKVEMSRENGRMSFNEIPGTEFSFKCELVLLAMGYTG